MGVLPQDELAQLKNLSMGEVLERIVGHWGMIIIVFSLMLSVSGAFLAWLLLAAESLFTPAKEGLLPQCLAVENKRAVPKNSLWLTSGFIQLFLIITCLKKSTYLALILLATSMILVPYLFSAIYAVKIALDNHDNKIGFRKLRKLRKNRFLNKDCIIGMLAIVYCGWLLYAAGFKYLLLSTVLYTPGALFYMVAKRQQRKPVFKLSECIIFALMLFLAAVSAYLLITNKLTL
jgi:arginine:ornithine antiporter/lysine permease